jgi:hypothetical protein
MKLKISLLLSLILNSPISGHQELRSIEFFVYSQSRLEGLHFRTLQKNPRTDPVQIRPIPIKSHYLHSTGPYAYYGTPELSFFHANSKQELANLKLKADTPTKLLVFLDNPDYGIAANALRYRIVPFSLNPQRAVAGQLSFLNLSGLQVVAKVNDHILHLKPNSQLSCRSESHVELQIALAGPQGPMDSRLEKALSAARKFCPSYAPFSTSPHRVEPTGYSPNSIRSSALTRIGRVTSTLISGRRARAILRPQVHKRPGKITRRSI